MGSTSTNNAASVSIEESIVKSFKLKVNYAKNLHINQCYQSPKFNHGGHDWSVFCSSAAFTEEIIFISLKLESKAQGVKTTFDLSLLDKDGNPSISVDAFKRTSHLFNYKNETPPCPLYVRRNLLEKEYLIDGCFVVLCTIFIAGEVIRDLPKVYSGLEDLGRNLLKSGEEMADLIFEVDGEIFRVHKAVLVAVSPVFRGELGSMDETRTKRIKIENMKAIVFKCLIHYMYTNVLDDDNNTVIIHDLLVAADRYEVEGLRMMCEERLLKNISLDTVINCLVLADEQNCNWLKNACLDFAAELENFVQLTLTKEYLQLMEKSPSVFSELRERVSSSVAFKQFIGKKRRVM